MHMDISATRPREARMACAAYAYAYIVPIDVTRFIMIELLRTYNVNVDVQSH